MAFTLTSRLSGEVTVLDLSGRLELGGGAPVLREMLQNVTAGGARKILLNLREVSFIDSSGLGEIASGHARAKSGGTALKLVGLRKRAEDLFQMTGLYRILDVYAEESDALRSWDESPVS